MRRRFCETNPFSARARSQWSLIEKSQDMVIWELGAVIGMRLPRYEGTREDAAEAGLDHQAAAPRRSDLFASAGRHVGHPQAV